MCIQLSLPPKQHQTTRNTRFSRNLFGRNSSLPWRNQHLFPGPTKFMVAVHGRMMYQVPSSYDLVHNRFNDVICQIISIIDLVVFINQTFDIFEAMHWSMELWKSAKWSLASKMWSQWRSQKKIFAMLEKAESQAVGGLG